VGSWLGSEWSGEKIPTFMEVLDLLPRNKKLFVEIKEKDLSLLVIEEIKKASLPKNQITIISFYESIIKEMKEKTDLECNLLVSFSQQNISAKSVSERLLFLNADGVGAENHKNLNESFMKKIKDLNKEVHVWTVDDNEALRYRDMGISSITTNVPKKIKEIIQKS